MNEMSITSYAEKIIISIDFKNNPYFIHLLAGDFEKADFIETQIQLYFVTHFLVRPLGALVGKIPECPTRLNIIENLYEEHGEGFVDEFHKNTFLSFLNNLGVTKENIKLRALWPEVRAFNMTLLGSCMLDDYLVAAPMLGIIEYMFSSVSSWTEQGILQRDWLNQDQMRYYKTHEKLDIKHAQDFFLCVEKNWFASEEDKYYIQQGIHLGAYCFNNLYEELYKHRKRREYRKVDIPHISL